MVRTWRIPDSVESAVGIPAPVAWSATRRRDSGGLTGRRVDMLSANKFHTGWMSDLASRVRALTARSGRTDGSSGPRLRFGTSANRFAWLPVGIRSAAAETAAIAFQNLFRVLDGFKLVRPGPYAAQKLIIRQIGFYSAFRPTDRLS
jgi:hypothetical protein